MAELTLYSFEDADGTEDTYTTMDPVEEKEYAMRYKRKMIAQTYEYSDSEEVEDFTGSDDEDEED